MYESKDTKMERNVNNILVFLTGFTETDIEQTKRISIQTEDNHVKEEISVIISLFRKVIIEIRESQSYNGDANSGLKQQRNKNQEGRRMNDNRNLNENREEKTRDQYTH